MHRKTDEPQTDEQQFDTVVFDDNQIQSPVSTENSSAENNQSQISNLIPQNFSGSNKTWTNQQTTDLLTTCLENNLFDFKDSTVFKNKLIYDKSHLDMKKIGHEKSYDQVMKKISNLRSDYSECLKTINKSGAAGLNKILEKRPYWEKMKALFGKRPRETAVGIDSLNADKLLEMSINKDHEIKPLKKPSSNALSMMDKSIDRSHKFDGELFRNLMKHDKRIARKNNKTLAKISKDVVTGIGAVLKEVLQPAVVNNIQEQQSMSANFPTSNFGGNFPPGFTVSQYNRSNIPATYGYTYGQAPNLIGGSNVQQSFPNNFASTSQQNFSSHSSGHQNDLQSLQSSSGFAVSNKFTVQANTNANKK